MQQDKVKAAIMEATRFVSKATKLLKAEGASLAEGYNGNSPKESGACRRSSLDLSRALADMRRP